MILRLLCIWLVFYSLKTVVVFKFEFGTLFYRVLMKSILFKHAVTFYVLQHMKHITFIESWWNDRDKGSTKCSEERLYQCHCVHHKNALKYNVVLRDKYIRTEILSLQQVPQHRYMSYTGFI
jgi:hypothetical protein